MAAPRVEFGEAAQDKLRLRLRAASGLIVFDGFTVASRAFEHGGDVETTLILAAGAREAAVSVLVLAEAALREREVVPDALVRGREARGALEACDGRAVIAAQLERVAEVVQSLRVRFVVEGALEGFARAVV